MIMERFSDSDLDFTERATDSLFDVVDDGSFRERDAELIYRALGSRLHAIPFCNYLKRYIYLRAGLVGKYDEIPLSVYQEIIRDSFADTGTPPSFEPVSSKLSALSKNWLTQKTVKRKVVFLLGFGLNMSLEDVMEFLTKALREPTVNFKDPFEVICRYCFKNGYGYPRFERLWQRYLDMPTGKDGVFPYSEGTVGLRAYAERVTDDESLLLHLSRLKGDGSISRISETARGRFLSLYERARTIAADIYNRTEEDDSLLALSEYRRRLEASDRLYDFEKLERIEAKREKRRVYTSDDITPADIEQIILAAVPKDRHGNLIPSKMSRLNEHFGGKRFSRQHIGDVLSEKAEVDRFDLITLNFFIFSESLDEYPDNKTRFLKFEDSTNALLGECGMGELYIPNPYECFVMMCMAADDPLGTYADVCEISYE